MLLVLAVGGAIAARRRMRAQEGHFERSLAQVNRDLAAAHAEDNGWERDTSRPRRAAPSPPSPRRRAHRALELVQVIDRPGTDDDQAVFR